MRTTRNGSGKKPSVRKKRYGKRNKERFSLIPLSEPYFAGNERKYLLEAFDSGWVSSLGSFIGRFEKSFASYCGAGGAESCCNGTAALHLALSAFGAGKGDEIIVPAFTFISTANTVRFCGAEPVFTDIDKKSWNIDPEKIEEKITKKTKGIIPVDIYGCPAPMDEVNGIAEKHGLFVLEDCAESHGSEYHQKKTGSLADASIFSFYGNKTITTGEGGMVTSDDKEFLEKVNLLKNHAKAREKELWHSVIGFNYRMTNLQAAIGLAQLEKIDEIVERKRKNAAGYAEGLEGLESLTLPSEPENVKSNYWLYSVLAKDSSMKELIIRKLQEQGIDARAVFYPVTDMPPYRSGESFPVSKEVSSKGISLPSSAKLEKDEISMICGSIKKILAR
jgi:perosamine synthetase